MPVGIRIEQVNHWFNPNDPPVLRDICVAVEAGQSLALVGESGCGKSTLLNMIAGMIRPSAGAIYIGETKVVGPRPEWNIMFQQAALYPWLSVLDNVALGLEFAGVGKARRGQAVKMLERVGLADKASSRPGDLSGGQQQRVALARTLAPAPQIVLLDEPFSNLDTAMRVETRQEVRSLLKKAGSAAILVTHDQEEALALADRVALMEGGRVVQIGTPDEIYRNPASAFVASFLGRSNILTGNADGMDADTPFGRLPLSRAANGEVRLAVRPEQIMLEPDPDAGAAIVGREFRGHDQLYWVQEGDRCMLVISGPGAQLEVGSRVRLRICDCVVPLS